MEPKDFARLLLRRKSTIIMATLIVMGTVLSMSLRAAPQYVAACEVLFKAMGAGLSNEDAQGIEPFGSIETNLDIVTSEAVTTIAAEKLGWPYGDVAGKTNVSLKGTDTQIILLQVADTPPATVPAADAPLRAAAICNAQANAYIEYRRAEGARAYRNELATIRNDQINTQADLDVARREYEAAYDTGNSALTVEKLNTFNNLVALKGELDRDYTAISSRLKRGLEGEGGEIYREARGSARVGGDLKRNAMLGMIIGLMFGVGIALIREYLDDTVKDKEQAARELGLPILANLPATSELDGFDGPPQATIEAARTLRATLAQYGFPNEKRMLLVASSLSKRRSTTLAALAGAVAESGRSVLVIGSDLRSSRTHEAFGIANTLGLANVVRGQVPLRNAIRPAPGLENVYVLPCGPVIGSPGEILSSEAMAFVLREAREWADVVLLDAPPVLAAADASILGAYSDGVVLVVSAGRTSRGKAAEAREQLAAAGARVLGAVLIGGDDERDRDAIDDLDGFLPTGGYGSFEPAYASVGAGDDWYGDDVINVTARTDSAPRRPGGSRPSKKVSAAGREQRVRRLAEPSVPASARTAARRPAPSAAPRRATTARPAAPAGRGSAPAKRTTTAPAKRATTARTAAPAKRTTTARTAAPAKRTPTARAAAPAKRAATARTAAPAKRTTTAKKTTAKRTSAAARTTAKRAPARTSASRASVRTPARSTSKTRTSSGRSRTTTRR